LRLGPKRSSEREKQFHWVGPLLSSHTNIYVKAGSPLRVRTLDDAKALSSILVLRASYSFQDLSSKGFKNLYEVNDAPSMVRMLMADRAPAMILESTLLGAVRREAGAKQDEIASVYELHTPTSNLAFSRAVPQQTVKQWQAAFDALKDDGSYTKLYEKWFGPSQVDRR
jgi:polar amino acid transport system substrate-binding protein